MSKANLPVELALILSMAVRHGASRIWLGHFGAYAMNALRLEKGYNDKKPDADKNHRRSERAPFQTLGDGAKSENENGDEKK